MAKKKAKTKKSTTPTKFTNVIIIDASGSMSSKQVEVVKGLNDLFTEIKANAKRNKDIVHRTLVVDFSGSDDIRTLVDSTNVDDLTLELANGYTTRGMTALYDAIGLTFKKLDGVEGGVFVNILTDGDENASREFNHAAVKSAIEKGRAAGWGITFMGTTEESIEKAVSFGVSIGNTMKFANTSVGVSRGFKATNSLSSAYYSANTAGVAIDVDNLVADNVDDKED